MEGPAKQGDMGQTPYAALDLLDGAVGPEVILSFSLLCCVTILLPPQKKFNMGVFPSWESSSSLVQETLLTLVLL